MQKQVNVLIVDDEEIMRSLFTDILKDEGYKLTTVCNGKEAQEIIKKESFDIAFVDVHMPIMDGIKTLKMLRQEAPDTAVVMMDSMPEFVDEDPREQGAIACIKKPFNIDEIKDIVDRIKGQ